jgi:hypothetical protein
MAQILGLEKSTKKKSGPKRTAPFQRCPLGEIRAAVKAWVRDQCGERRALRGLNPLTRMIAHEATGRRDDPMRQDATLAIRADILRRIDALAAQRGHLSVPRIHDEIDQIRHIARSFHFDAIEGLADTLQSVLSVNGHGPTILSYLDLMREAASESIAIPAPHIVALCAPPHFRA